MSSLSYNNRHTYLHTNEVSQLAARRPKDLQTHKINCRNSYADKGSRKKITVFFSGPALPSPSSLVVKNFFQDFFLELQKMVFFLSGQALASTLLVVGPL